MPHHFSRADFASLERLRGRFLAAQPGAGDYWRSEADLELYDRTFGERIGWKWDSVLQELVVRGWRPRARQLFDWGCGTGIASRRVLEAWPGQFETLTLFDRSPLALRHAAGRAKQLSPEVAVQSGSAPAPGSLMLLSHVLNELDARALRELRRALLEAEEIIWVEAGTHAESRRLVEEIREPLLASGFVPVAPCTHTRPCGLRVPENARHWCHSFGRPPSSAFQNAAWAEFAQGMGIDLRALPYSFLVLARAEAAAPGPEGASRVLGHPREYKGHLKVLSCQAEGVCEMMLQKRDAPELYRRVREEDAVPIYRWERQGDRIAGGSNLP